MAAIAPTAQVRGTVELALRGSKRDIAGRVFQGALLLSLLLSLLILIVLLGTALSAAWPVVSTRLGDFVTSDVSRLPARAGVRQGIVGSLILIGFVAVVAMPLGIAAAIYLQEYARDTRLNRAAHPPTSATSRLCRRSSTASSGSWCSCRRSAPSRGPSVRPELHLGRADASVLVLPIVIIVTMEACAPCPRGPRGRLRRGRHPVGGRAEPRAAVRGTRGLHGLDPVDGPGLRGDGATAAGGRRHRLPVDLVAATPLEVLQGKYTALPTQIYSWSRRRARTGGRTRPPRSSCCS